MNILEQMQTETIKDAAVGSLQDARAQLGQLSKLEKISIALVVTILALAWASGWIWFLALIGIAAPTAFFPPQTNAAKRLNALQRKHVALLIYVQCLEAGGVALFIMLMIFCGISSAGAAIGNFLLLFTVLFVLYRSFSKIRFYNKTVKHIVAQQTTLAG